MTVNSIILKKKYKLPVIIYLYIKFGIQFFFHIKKNIIISNHQKKKNKN